MRLNQVLEAKYAFRQNAKCHACQHEFNFQEDAEKSFFRDSVNCPKCGAGNQRDDALRRKRKSDEAKRNI